MLVFLIKYVITIDIGTIGNQLQLIHTGDNSDRQNRDLTYNKKEYFKLFSSKNQKGYILIT